MPFCYVPAVLRSLLFWCALFNRCCVGNRAIFPCVRFRVVFYETCLWAIVGKLIQCVKSTKQGATCNPR